MQDEMPQPRPKPPKAEPASTLSEAELSRMAREAVHQPPDARLDKQLMRMGLLDAAETVEPQLAQPTSRPVAIDPEAERLREELERLREELRHTRVILWLLVAVIAVFVVVAVVLLLV